MKPSNYIIIPCGVIALLFVAEAFLKDNNVWALYGAPFIIILAGVYVLSPQIDWWFLKRQPKPLSPDLEALLSQNQWYYKKLAPEMKLLYSKKAALFMLGSNFFRPASDEERKSQVPEDLKLIIAAAAAQILMGLPESHFSKFDNFMVCPGLFPTPVHRNPHNSELYAADGVVLFSAPALMQGFTQQPRVFQLALYELGRVFFWDKVYAKLAPSVDAAQWSDLENISGMTKNFIETTIGLAHPDVLGVAVHHFFNFPQRFNQLLPDVYQMLCNALNQNPMKEMNPVVVS